MELSSFFRSPAGFCRAHKGALVVREPWDDVDHDDNVAPHMRHEDALDCNLAGNRDAGR